MSDQQRLQWRNIAVLGLLFSISVIHSFLATPFYLNLNTEYFNSVYIGEPYHLFENPQPSAYPFLVVLITLTNAPFFLGALHLMVRINTFLPADAPFLKTVIQTSNNGAFMMAVLANAARIFAELYTDTIAEFSLFAKWSLMFLYFFVVLTGIGLIGFGMYTTKSLSRFLGRASIVMGSSAIILGFWSPNVDLPSFRFILGLIPLSIDIVIWSSFLWLGSRPAQAEDHPTTVTG